MDKDVGVKAKPTIQKIIDSREERSDDFSLNQKMRARFRKKKHDMKREESRKAAEIAKFGMRVIPSSQLSESDQKLKSKVKELQQRNKLTQQVKDRRDQIRNESIFAQPQSNKR